MDTSARKKDYMNAPPHESPMCKLIVLYSLWSLQISTPSQQYRIIDHQFSPIHSIKQIRFAAAKSFQNGQTTGMFMYVLYMQKKFKCSHRPKGDESPIVYTGRILCFSQFRSTTDRVVVFFIFFFFNIQYSYTYLLFANSGPKLIIKIKIKNTVC